ncbi:MAG TPA: DNA alkylation repair protein, partial [Candidatus Micrarchaeota archaeon]|nr:DNA alkylation repair protein [Candidatus Micrarchaeota archaeon]
TEELKTGADDKTRESGKRFFKEEVKLYGVKTGDAVKIANKYWKESVGKLGKEEVFALCAELYKTDYYEDGVVAATWAPKLAKQFEPADLEVFRSWIDLYINNWAKCDGFCNHTVGEFMGMYPERLADLKVWAKSKNRWMRRAAAVSLIVPAKRGRFLKDAFEIADILLLDGDDMVQKGYGWLLKEESRKHQQDVFDYVVKHKKVMPRTALRYAIELMPKELRIEAMKKE